MLGAGIKLRRIHWAMIVAGALHLVVLSMQLESLTHTPLSEPVIQLELQAPAVNPPEPVPQVSPPTAVIPVKIDTTELITTEPSASKTPAEVRLQTSLNSEAFRRYVISETQKSIQQNPNLLQQFSDSFETKWEVTESPQEITRDALPRDTGSFMAHVKGRRLCAVKMDSLLDNSAAPMILTKDCTPDKKFELDLNAPNNGWMNR